MKKIFISLIIISYFFLFPHNITADFLRWPENPIIKPDRDYDVNGLLAPTVVYKNGKYHLWYASIDSNNTLTISYALSNDGFNWEKYQNNPVIKPDSNNPYLCEKGAHDPEVIWNKNINRFQIWYVVNCEPQVTGIPRYWVKYGESDDGINWQIENQPVLSPSLNWEKEGISSPTVLLENDQYKMWYAARDSGGNWRIGYASSSDGKNWIKYQNNPILYPTQSWEITHIAGNDIFKDNNQYFLYYYGAAIWPPINIVYATSSDGLMWEKPSNNPLLGPTQTETNLTGPDIIKDQYEKKIYYSAMIYGKWNISLLVENLNPPTPAPTNSPTPTPSPTPSLTFTPPTILTPTPIPTKIPVIILPGLMASWNKKAIIYNQNVPFDQWKLLSFVKEYHGISQSLINLGYKKDENLFLIPYDWRKPVKETVKDIYAYLNEKLWKNHPHQKINIVGHSLGGLIGRILTQDYPEKINKVITVGTPHLGVVQVYKPLEAGELETDNSFLWLAEKIILILNKSTIETDKQTIQKRFPVLFDLFPIFNFLKNKKNQYILTQNLKIKNQILLTYNSNFDQIYPMFYAIYGEKEEKTPAGYFVDSQTALDKLLNNYQDGRPTKIFYGKGDDTVLSQSAKQDADAEKLPFDHGEIITKKNAIEKIFTILFSSSFSDKIIEGEKTVIAPSLVFLIQSPITIKVKFKDQTFNEEEGIILIPNAQSGKYLLEIKGIDYGKYAVHIGQITSNNNIWEKIEGEIKKTPPTDQTEQYEFYFNNITAQPLFPTLPPTTSFQNSSANTNTNSTTTTNNSQSNENNISNSENKINQPRPNSSFYALNIDKKKETKEKNQSKSEVLGIKKKSDTKNNNISRKRNLWPIILIIFLILIIAIGIFLKKNRFKLILFFKTKTIIYFDRIKKSLNRIIKF